MNSSATEELKNIAYKAKQLGRAHALAADICEERGKIFSIPAVILSSIVAASAIAALGDFDRAKC